MGARDATTRVEAARRLCYSDPMAEPIRNPKTTPPSSRFAWLFEAKLTPGIAALFFVALAIMCAAAAGIGYVVQNQRQTAVRR